MHGHVVLIPLKFGAAATAVVVMLVGISFFSGHHHGAAAAFTERRFFLANFLLRKNTYTKQRFLKGGTYCPPRIFRARTLLPQGKDAASPLIPPPPPVSLPVWSFATPCATGRTTAATANMKTNMNIVTFCSAVSVSPPKLWIISLYHGTLTKDSFLESRQGILQLLCPDQKHLVPILGKRSGYEEGYDKRSECAKLGFDWWQRRVSKHQGSETKGNPIDTYTPTTVGNNGYNDIYLLPGCASYIVLELRETMEAGDHVVALCEMVGTGVWEPTTDANRESKKNSRDPTNDNSPPKGSVIFQTTVSTNSTAATTAASRPASLDTDTVLYTGQLRREGIL